MRNVFFVASSKIAFVQLLSTVRLCITCIALISNIRFIRKQNSEHNMMVLWLVSKMGQPKEALYRFAM